MPLRVPSRTPVLRSQRSSQADLVLRLSDKKEKPKKVNLALLPQVREDLRVALGGSREPRARWEEGALGYSGSALSSLLRSSKQVSVTVRQRPSGGIQAFVPNLSDAQAEGLAEANSCPEGLVPAPGSADPWRLCSCVVIKQRLGSW